MAFGDTKLSKTSAETGRNAAFFSCFFCFDALIRVRVRERERETSVKGEGGMSYRGWDETQFVAELVFAQVNTSAVERRAVRFPTTTQDRETGESLPAFLGRVIPMT